MRWLSLLFRCCLLSLFGSNSLLVIAAERCVTDDAQQTLCLTAPAQRIATLSPGATELMFAAGAGDLVIAGVNHSDYPPAAQKLPLVGNHTRIDLEALLALQPDLIITWVSGNPPRKSVACKLWAYLFLVLSRAPLKGCPAPLNACRY